MTADTSHGDDLAACGVLLGAASQTDGALRTIYVASARAAYQRATARAESLRVLLDAAEAELVRRAEVAR